MDTVPEQGKKIYTKIKLFAQVFLLSNNKNVKPAVTLRVNFILIFYLAKSFF